MRGVRKLGLIAATVASLVALPGVAQAASGALDPSFGTGGLVETHLGGPAYSEDYAGDVATDSSGRVVVAGRSERNGQTESDAIVVRYTASGALDPSFGNGDGIVRLHFGANSFDGLGSVAIDGNGRIVVAGNTASDIHCTTYCDPVIARLTESGQLDPTFSGDGVVTISGDERYASSVTIDGSGRILVACGSAVYRLTEAGVFDTTFGHLGRAPVEEAYYDLAVDSAGRIVVASDYAVKRLLSDGQRDFSFGVYDDGSASVDISPGSSDFVYAVAVDADDRIIAGGVSIQPGSPINGQPFIVRFTPSGVLDESFGSSGIVLGSDEGLVTDLLVDHAGRYLATGYSDELEIGSDVLIRYLPDGSFDTAFGGGFGFVTVAFFAGDVAVDKDQRILVSGVGGEEGGDEIDFAVARYLGDITPPPPAPSPTPSVSLPAGSSTTPTAPGAPTTRLGKVTINGAKRIATFRFLGQGGAALTFQCQLDRGPFKPCRSPKAYRKLKPGQHVFRVRARDALGQADRTPAIKRFRIPKGASGR